MSKQLSKADLNTLIKRICRGGDTPKFDDFLAAQLSQLHAALADQLSNHNHRYYVLGYPQKLKGLV